MGASYNLYAGKNLLGIRHLWAVVASPVLASLEQTLAGGAIYPTLGQCSQQRLII